MKIIWILILAIAANNIFANSVDEVIAYKDEPPGVVFEIVSGRPDLLKELLPELRNDIKNIRMRFPELSIAIVTHGSEQFSLTTKKTEKYSTVHKIAEAIVVEDKVDLHVCGTYAEWRGILPEDFPDYVDVAPSGPAQINSYTELGYVLITIP